MRWRAVRIAMINQGFSLEEMPVGYDGAVQLPVICGACYQAMHPERYARSTPRSYAALADSPYRFVVLDWKGLDTTTCRCCASQQRGERWAVEPVRKTVK